MAALGRPRARFETRIPADCIRGAEATLKTLSGPGTRSLCAEKGGNKILAPIQCSRCVLPSLSWGAGAPGVMVPVSADPKSRSIIRWPKALLYA